MISLNSLCFKKLPLNHRGSYVVIYTFEGQDPQFPIVGEVVQYLSNGRVFTTPKKWTDKGRAVLFDTRLVDPYSFDKEDWWVEANIENDKMVASIAEVAVNDDFTVAEPKKKVVIH
jgi:hypothetical protein